MVHCHLLQLISRRTSIGCYPADLSHCTTRRAIVVIYQLLLSRSGSRTVVRVSYGDGLPNSQLNDAALIATDWILIAIVSGERNQHLGMGF